MLTDCGHGHNELLVLTSGKEFQLVTILEELLQAREEDENKGKAP